MSKDKSKDKKPPHNPAGDKNYLEGSDVDTSLSKTEQHYLRMKKKPKGHEGRQDVFTDRRDPYREKDYLGDERRTSRKDRRDP